MPSFNRNTVVAFYSRCGHFEYHNYFRWERGNGFHPEDESTIPTCSSHPFIIVIDNADVFQYARFRDRSPMFCIDCRTGDLYQDRQLVPPHKIRKLEGEAKRRRSEYKKYVRRLNEDCKLSEEILGYKSADTLSVVEARQVHFLVYQLELLCALSSHHYALMNNVYQ